MAFFADFVVPRAIAVVHQNAIFFVTAVGLPSLAVPIGEREWRAVEKLPLIFLGSIGDSDPRQLLSSQRHELTNLVILSMGERLGQITTHRSANGSRPCKR